MKKVSLTHEEVNELNRIDKLDQKINKSSLLSRKLMANFWDKFAKDHGYHRYKANIEEGTVHQLGPDEN